MNSSSRPVEPPFLENPLERLLHLAGRKDCRYIIALAGYPGSGKSTLCGALERDVNQRLGPGSLVVLGMDGFHLSREQLSRLDNPVEAMARRGAPYTFDPAALVAKMRELRSGWKNKTVGWPGFDHGVGDPEPDARMVPAEASLILVEGIYTLLREGPWAALEDFFDEKWFLDLPLETAMDRVTLRHARVWHMTAEKARIRAESNDRLNCAHIKPGRGIADFLVGNTLEIC